MAIDRGTLKQAKVFIHYAHEDTKAVRDRALRTLRGVAKSQGIIPTIAQWARRATRALLPVWVQDEIYRSGFIDAVEKRHELLRQQIESNRGIAATSIIGANARGSSRYVAKYLLKWARLDCVAALQGECWIGRPIWEATIPTTQNEIVARRLAHCRRDLDAALSLPGDSKYRLERDKLFVRGIAALTGDHLESRSFLESARTLRGDARPDKLKEIEGLLALIESTQSRDVDGQAVLPLSLLEVNRTILFPANVETGRRNGVQRLGGVQALVSRCCEVIRRAWTIDDARGGSSVHLGASRSQSLLNATTWLANALGIPVIYEPDTAVPACLIKTSSGRAIYIDKRLSNEPRAFSIAHELAHEILNHREANHLLLGPTQNDIERHHGQEAEADAFADGLLHVLRGVVDLWQPRDEASPALGRSRNPFRIICAAPPLFRDAPPAPDQLGSEDGIQSHVATSSVVPSP